MCISPISIKNPNYGQSYEFLRRTVDVSSQYIRVPCGNCAACRFVKQSGLFQRILIESENSYIYFVTLTYESLSVHHVNVDGEVFSVAQYKDFQNYLKRLRKIEPFKSRGLRYVVCREYGKKRGRPHFHFLLFLRSLDTDLQFTPFELEKSLKSLLLAHWQRNMGSFRNPLYKPLCHYHEKLVHGVLRKNFDCHLIQYRDGSIDTALWYVLKYMAKDSALYTKMKLCLFDKYGEKNSDYYHELNLLKPKIWKSVGFGNPPGIRERVQSMVDLSIQENSPFPMFIYKGHRLPLSRYYKSKYLRESDIFHFADLVRKENNGIVVFNSFNVEEQQRISEDFERKLEKFDTSDILDLFEDD